VHLRLALLAPLALIACNKAPEGLAVALGPGGATTDQDLILEVTEDAVDPNRADEVVLEVTWTVDGVEVPDLQDALVVPAARTERGQSWSAEVVATDGRKPAEAVSASLIVANTAPEASMTVVPKGEALSTEDLVATVEASDLDGDAITIEWAWTVDGVPSSHDTGTVPAADTAKGQVWEVTATATDGTDSAEPLTASFTVVNSVPSVGAARVSPSLVYEATTVSCKGGGWADLDGDPESYEVVWRVNDRTVSTEDELTGVDFDRGDTIACTLTPVDETSAGDPVASAPITVRNTQAVVISGALTPSSPTVTSTLEARVDAVIDGDGDFAVVRYVWYVNGDVLDHTASYLQGDQGWFEKGDEVKVWLRGYDGIEDGKGPAYSQIIENSPPGAPEVAVRQTTSSVLCEVVTDAVDADEDTVSYSMSWEQDGSAWAGATSSTTWAGDTVSLDDTRVGETWTCVATPDDGEDAGASASAHTILTAD